LDSQRTRKRNSVQLPRHDVGSREGTQFLLAEGKQSRIGRGLDCDIILADALSSRVHAIVFFEEGSGAFATLAAVMAPSSITKKLTTRLLVDRCVLKIGSTEFEFHSSQTKPSTRTGSTTRRRSFMTAASCSNKSRANLASKRFAIRNGRTIPNAPPAQHEAAGLQQSGRSGAVSLELLRERVRASVVVFCGPATMGSLS